MSFENDNSELDAFCRIDPRPALLPALGWTHAPKGTPGGKIDRERWEKGGASASPFLGRDGKWRFRQGPDARATIVDLAKEQAGGLGRARQLLRQITGSSPETSPNPAPPSNFSSRPPASPPAVQDYRTPKEVMDAIDAEAGPFTDATKIPPYLVARGFRHIHPVFRERMKVSLDQHRNVIFPYFVPADGSDGAVIVSRERIGQGYKGYLENTRAGVWIAAPKNEIRLVVICEAPLDCISSAGIRKDDMDHTAFFALRSGAEEACAELVARIIAKRGVGARVELRTDNDPAGLLYAAKVGSLLKKRDIRAIYVAPPEDCVDWTEHQEQLFMAQELPTQELADELSDMIADLG